MKSKLKPVLVIVVSLAFVFIYGCKNGQSDVVWESSSASWEVLPEQNDQHCQKTPLIKGMFGKAFFDEENLSLKQLWLKQSDGKLCSKSLLSQVKPTTGPWATGGYTYVVGADGKRYESRYSTDHDFQVQSGRFMMLMLAPDAWLYVCHSVCLSSVACLQHFKH